MGKRSNLPPALSAALVIAAHASTTNCSREYASAVLAAVLALLRRDSLACISHNKHKPIARGNMKQLVLTSRLS